jgi:uncharacterized protein YabN with tetrapyrrole methylase and pyrophosphatase domain
MPQIDLYMIGTGIQFPSHLSLQTLEIVARCEVVFTNLPSERLHLLPTDVRNRMHSLWHLYQPNRLRRANYADVVRAVLDGAQHRRPAAWLTFGHPMVFDSVTAALLEQGRAKGWTTQVVPAISTIDTLIADLEFEPASGLCVYEATVVVSQNIVLSAGVATLLLQPSAFQSNRAMPRPEDVVVQLAPLRDYLCKYFPPNHSCAFVRSANTDGEEPLITWSELRSIAAIEPLKIAGSTLYIPAIKNVGRI